MSRLTIFCVFTVFLAQPAQAQLAPICENANGYSLSVAEDLINRGDAIILQAPDCSQVNLMFCQDAENLYRQAAVQVEQVFAVAKGNGCTYCDIGRIGSLAWMLRDRQAYFLRNLSYDTDLAYLWNDWQGWSQAPTCQQATGTPPLPTPPPVVGTPVSNCNSTGGYAASRLNASPGLTIPGVTYFDDCQGRCDQNDWCRSFDMDFNNSICILHDRTKEEVGLLPAPQGYSHFVCQGR